MWMRNLWNNQIELIWNPSSCHQVRGQTFWMFHLKTNNLQINPKLTSNFRPYLSIQSMHFVFPFCPIQHGYIVVPISKINWEKEATLLSDFSKFLSLRVSTGTSEKNSWDFFNIKFTLGNLIPRPRSSLIDRGLAEFIFPNTTFIDRWDQTCFCCKLNLVYNSSLGNIEYFEGTGKKSYYEVPILYMDVSLSEILLVKNEDRYTFLSCGNPYSERANYTALFMPFTKLVWALIILTVFGWPLVLSLIENDFNLKKVLKDFDALFIGWAMILEQSHLRATNYKGRGPLYCYCGCVLLAIFILSNAYKGDNIRTLTKSFELVPLTRMSQIIEAGYKTYRNQICMDFLEKFFKLLGTDACIDEFYDGRRGRASQFTDAQFKLWEPSGYTRAKRLTQVGVDFFENCKNNKALLGWRSVLEPLEKKLRRKKVNADIYLGEEFIYTRHVGWRLKRYGTIKVLKRMWTIVESGVHTKILNMTYKPPTGTVYEPRRIKIQGNISTQFVFHSCGLLLALLIFIAELHKSAIRFFMLACGILGLWFKNFVLQSRKFLLCGLKFLLNNRKDFCFRLLFRESKRYVGRLLVGLLYCPPFFTAKIATIQTYALINTHSCAQSAHCKTIHAYT